LVTSVLAAAVLIVISKRRRPQHQWALWTCAWLMKSCARHGNMDNVCHNQCSLVSTETLRLDIFN